MKGLILSGGTGSRLRPLTYTSAKQLIPVANKPILFYALEAIVAAGVTDLGIVVGDTAPEIKQAVGDGTRWGARVTYIRQDAPRGLAHAVKVARPFLDDSPFIMYLGDNIVREGVTEFVERFRRRGPDSLVLLSEVDEPQRFGVAEVRDGRVARLVEKPQVPPSNLALVGVYMFSPRVHDAVDDIKPSRRNELEITDAIQWLLDHRCTVEHHLVGGWWKDTGKPEDVLEANRLVLETLEPEMLGDVDASSQIVGRAAIGPEARIIRSTVRGPAIIGPGSVIEDSYIGPFTAIAPGVRILGSEVEHSVVLEDSVIDHVPGRIDESLIGRNVRVTRATSRPRAYRLILGDNSQAGVG